MAEAVLPPSVLVNLTEVQSALQVLEQELDTILPGCQQDILEHLNPVDRATTFLQLARTTGSLFSLYLRTKGISPDDHPVRKELDRVGLYVDKVERASYKSTAPSRPTSSVDVPAAGRFIEHALPDLTQEQRLRVQQIGTAGNSKKDDRRRYGRHEPQKHQSVVQAAESFLAEAQKELRRSVKEA
eukprot:TRINITY_DN14673_c0_g1_i1.p1 TRINITY_DN14673_c0_g1~~TRINITY_DN14673_c0_g1_i1.p1  ORF type:complete len:185 (+),score=20.47 TRINITY_DN14673_c0_g1_i1:435-989(+)